MHTNADNKVRARLLRLLEQRAIEDDRARMIASHVVFITNLRARVARGEVSFDQFTPLVEARILQYEPIYAAIEARSREAWLNFWGHTQTRN